MWHANTHSHNSKYYIRRGWEIKKEKSLWDAFKSPCSTPVLRMIKPRGTGLFLSALVYQTHITQVIFSHSLLEVFITPPHFISEEVWNPPFCSEQETIGKTAWENAVIEIYVSMKKNLSVRSLPVSFRCLLYTGGPLWVIHFHLLITLIEVPQSFHNDHNSITQTLLRHFINTNEASGPPTTPNDPLSSWQSHTSMFRHKARSDHEVLNHFSCSEKRELGFSYWVF